MSKLKCEDCIWCGVGKWKGSICYVCRINPPTGAEEHSTFPVIEGDDDWCGCHNTDKTILEDLPYDEDEETEDAKFSN